MSWPLPKLSLLRLVIQGSGALQQQEVRQIYQDMWQHAWPLIHSNEITPDPYLSGKPDRRRGITLLARITDPLNAAIRQFLNEAYTLEPTQYYYPNSDLHVTVMSILSCEENFQLLLSDKPAYVNLIQNIVQGIRPFIIEFDGLTVAESGVVLCGYNPNNALSQLRNALRHQVTQSALAHSMDKRYTLMTAHSTVLRFKEPLQAPSRFSEFLQANRQRYFGQLRVEQLELVVNDWYQSKANTELLGKFDLLES
jgi:2'-5' RNA ligase